MFAGHIGAALAIGTAERRVNVGWFVAAALLLDVLLWLFVLLGWESVSIPADFPQTHQAEFVFPFSHGLLAALLWAGMTGLAAFAALKTPRRGRAAALLALAVFSHWGLDALVHRPELPLAGPGSFRVGLGGWDHLTLALALEAALVVAGLWLFMSRSTLARRQAVALVLLSLLALAFTVSGMTLAPAPPSATAMAAGSLATLVTVCTLAVWLGRPRRVAD